MDARMNMKRWLPLLVWIIIIFGLSSIPKLSGDYPDMPIPVDKVAHFIEYTILAILFHRGLGDDTLKRRISSSIFVFFICLGIAAMDELHQSYIPGRQSSIYDVLADLAGIVAATVYVLLRGRKKVKKGVEAYEIQSTERNK
jgi:VanZ family protein